ncbi:hypothetical protein TCAL_12450 [Tigriopus californicus]|uniref:CUB domain-containing protein n=1 Tax=Tigriopus californicus TaxID=6832 RepID=A0A553PA04_TIGCA|nr:hypothetical protein TCAL_12450 [Tigriopus californicus]|eukprot:TCALIF_12450-PA protein Name:"Protein of unknown function" AED:0.18 eAED:0.18 QI:283/0.72/0.83/1/0.54/0.58/12/106/276
MLRISTSYHGCLMVLLSLVTLSCGGMSSENCTYLVQTSTTTAINPCKYTICPCDKHICRLRFDFTNFNINGPVTASAISDVDLSAATTLGGAIGDCTTDTFTITAPGNFAPPLICGFNSGQHSNGTISKQNLWFQFPHHCSEFGNNNTTSGGNKARGETDGKCRGDYLLIPNAQSNVETSDQDTFTIGSIGSDVRLSDRLCGRQFSSANDNGDRRMSRSVCTQQRPFRMTFKTDEDEVTQSPATGAPPNSAPTNELNRVPGGIVGFNLRWTLQACT